MRLLIQNRLVALSPIALKILAELYLMSYLVLSTLKQLCSISINSHVKSYWLVIPLIVKSATAA
jgi:hypothetical protein